MFVLIRPRPAISFLIETGTLLHFPDTSHGLRTLYFLCPVWLSECLERIMHLKSSRSLARNGVIRTEDLRVSWDLVSPGFAASVRHHGRLPVWTCAKQMLLVGTGFTDQTEEQYFQFLAKFEIALPVANNRSVTGTVTYSYQPIGNVTLCTMQCFPSHCRLLF